MPETLHFKSALDNKPFITAITQIDGKAKSSAAEIFTAFSTTAGQAELIGSKLYAAFAAPTAAISNGVKEVFDYTRNLENLSERTGISVGRLRDLTRTFEAAGLEADDAGSAVNRMQKFLQEAENGEAKNNDLLRKLGLNFLQLHQLAPEQQFALIGRAVAGLHDPIAQGQAAMELFSRSGGRLLAVFKNPDFRGDGALSVRAQQLEENAAQFDQASIGLSRAGDFLKSFYTGVAAEVVTPLNAALDGLEKIDLSGEGREFGDALITGATGVVRMLNAIKSFDLPGVAEKFAGRIETAISLIALAGKALPALPDGTGAAASKASSALAAGSPALSIIQSIGDWFSGAGTALDLIGAVQALPDAIVNAFDTDAANKASNAKQAATPAQATPRQVITGDSDSLDDMTSTGIAQREKMGVGKGGTLGPDNQMIGSTDLMGDNGGLSRPASDTAEASRQNIKQIREQMLYQNPLLLNNAGALNSAVAQEQQSQRNQAQVKKYRETYDKQHPVEAQARQAQQDKTTGATSADAQKITTAVDNLKGEIQKLYAQ